MPDRLTPERLEEVACRMLEEAAFVLARPAPRAPEWEGEVIEVELGFAGPAQGTFRLRATPEFGAEVAANLMGLEPGDPEAATYAASALGEMLNIIAGAALAEAYGTGHVCRLGIPAARVGPPPPGGGAVDAVVLLGDDVHPIEVEVEAGPAR